MGLNRNGVTINAAMRMARAYYSKDKYDHAIRVMGYVAENEKIPHELQEECLALAIMHDLIEDTEFEGDELPENFHKALKLLTKSQDMDYIEYISEIGRAKYYSEWRMCAYWVKLADMKDHLMQKDTLTDKLKEKYWNAIPYLL